MEADRLWGGIMSICTDVKRYSWLVLKFAIIAGVVACVDSDPSSCRGGGVGEVSDSNDALGSTSGESAVDPS